MFKTIVVGTDGTDRADLAVNRAAELAALTGADLHLVSAYRPAPVRVRRPTGSRSATTTRPRRGSGGSQSTWPA